MSDLMKSLGRGCSRSLLIWVLAWAIGLFVFVPLLVLLVILPLGLVGDTDTSLWLLVFPVGLFLLLINGGILGALAWIVMRRQRRLDAVFEPLGFTGSLYQMMYRQYHGNLADRKISIYFSRGPLLEIDVATSLQTRLSVTGQHTDTRIAAQILHREPVALDDPQWAAFNVFALDHDWARRLLAHRDVPALLERLIHFEGWFTRRHVILLPGRFRLMLFGNRNLFKWDVNPEHVQSWLHDLLRLVHIAESIPAPTRTAELTSAERASQRIRGSKPWVLPAIIVGVMLSLVVCLIVAGVLAFLIASAS